MPNLLLELGVEELPSDALDVIEQHLESNARKILGEARLSFNGIESGSTPRRIALYIDNLATKQEDLVLDLTGPSKEKSFDDNGNPTKALQGFLKSKGAAIEDIEFKETPRGLFATLTQKEKGQKVQKVLPELVQELFLSLPYRKNMRWLATPLKFPRPIRWFVCLLDKQVLKIDLEGVKAGNRSLGHRFLSPKSFAILKADWKHYNQLLKKNEIILSQAERENLIRKGLQEKKLQKDLDEGLIRLTAQLVEKPYLLEGGFKKEYLQLPSEVLATCMRKHQKIFACYNASGKLLPKFVAVMNGKRKGLKRVQADFENVLESRLKDAQFFYADDMKKPLAERTQDLEQIVYLGKLGTLLDKVKRMEKVVPTLLENVGHAELQGSLSRVVNLAKVDLMTQLVYEFPELQGTAGEKYAIANGEDKEVAKAIGLQYLPQSLNVSQSEINKQFNELGALFGILDRLDLLVGAIGIGIQTGSSQDPYALRRAGGVLIKLIRAFRFSVSFRRILEAVIESYQGVLDKSKEEILDHLLQNFLKDRVIYELQIKQGTREFEIFEAVWKSSNDDLADIFNRFDILKKLAKQQPAEFMRVAKIIERTSNILKGTKEEIATSIDSSLLREPLEKQLYEILENNSGSISGLVQEGAYQEATEAFEGAFYQPVHNFFEEIMVNAEDANIRRNRQALIKQVNELYTRQLADLSVLSKIEIE